MRTAIANHELLPLHSSPGAGGILQMSDLLRSEPEPRRARAPANHLLLCFIYLRTQVNKKIIATTTANKIANITAVRCFI